MFLRKQDKLAVICVVIRAQRLWWRYQVPWKGWHLIRKKLQVPRPKVWQEWVEVQTSHRLGITRHYCQPIHTGVSKTPSFEWHCNPRVCTRISGWKFWNSTKLGDLCTCSAWKVQQFTECEAHCERK